MNANGSTERGFTRVFRNILVFGAILLAVLAFAGVVQSAASSPFVGHWLAIDLDGSEMALTLAGRPDGPFQVTWTDDYISYCNGEAGIIRGTAWLSENDTNLLEAEVHLDCFTTGAFLDFPVTLRYHSGTDTLSIQWDFGPVTIWHRPGKPLPQPQNLDLRVNYGDDWVESFYEAGHVAWITVTEGDGVTVKSTAEVLTEPREEWGGEAGFQTTLPGIEPGDWVFGWVDNGASAQAQIGEINGMIDLNADSFEGVVNAPWFSDQQVEVECLPWGAPEALDNVTFGMVTPDNNSPYSCSWAGEWNILPGQTVGVAYFGPDGHWVANTFAAFSPQIIASEAGDWFWTTGFNAVNLDLFIYESDAPDAALLWQGSRGADEGGFLSVNYEDHGQNLVPGNYIVVSDGNTQKELVLASISVDIFDTENESMAGMASPGSEVWAAAGPMEWQERIFAPAGDTGEWWADFSSIGFDITEEMRPWSFAHVYDGDGDANEGSTPPPPINLRVNYGHDWVESFYEAGHEVVITVKESDGVTVKAMATAFTEPMDFWGGESGFTTNETGWNGGGTPDLLPGDWVFAAVDNGVTAQVQLGDIQGTVDFTSDSITGVIEASWITDPVPVECLDWGSGGEPINKDAGFVYTTGANLYSCSWDAETEWDVQPWQDIGVGYLTPDGHWVANTFRDKRWMAMWTYDPPADSLQDGEYSYYFDLAYTVPEEVDFPPGNMQVFTVAEGTPLYGGYALLGPWNYMPVQVWNGSACEVVAVLNPDQLIRFISGWVNDYSMTYEEAFAHFSSITVDLYWNGAMVNSTSFTMSELLPFYSGDTRAEYVCTFTQSP